MRSEPRQQALSLSHDLTEQYTADTPSLQRLVDIVRGLIVPYDSRTQHISIKGNVNMHLCRHKSESHTEKAYHAHQLTK